MIDADGMRPENVALLRALGCEQQAREASDPAIKREWEALAIEWHQLANAIAKFSD